MDEERRKFLLMAVSSLVVAGTTPAMRARAAEGEGSVELEAFLASLLIALPDARAVGRRYLEVSPDQRSKAGELAAQIRPDGRLPAELARRLTAGRQSDLDSDNTLALDGWVIAWHEAWLCAAVSLI